MAKSLVVRMIATISVLIVTTCLLLSMVLVRRHLADIRGALVDRGQEISQFIAREAELGVLSGDVAALRQLASLARSYRDVVYCRFFDKDGSILISDGGEPKETPPAPGTGEPPREIWSFNADIRTMAVPRQREDIIADGGAGAGLTQRIGTVSIGIDFWQLRARRRIAFVTAITFTLFVALLAVAGAAILLHGTLRALANAAELAEERSRLAELKAKFVTNASHEFRTPLAVILASCEALARYGKQMAPDQQASRLTKIRRSVRHMTELLENVLTVGRADSGKLDCVRRLIEVDALCRDVVTDVEGGALNAGRVDIRWTCSVKSALLDPNLVRQILHNLLTNALKYSPDGGTVSLHVERRNADVTFRVTDGGIGILTADQATIFEPFQRGNNVGRIPGSGLGLAIARNAALAHGGTIGVQSSPGHGATFTVTLRESPSTQEDLVDPSRVNQA